MSSSLFRPQLRPPRQPLIYLRSQLLPHLSSPLPTIQMRLALQAHHYRLLPTPFRGVYLLFLPFRFPLSSLESQ